MKKKSRVTGTAPHVIAIVATLPLLPLTGPFGFLLYPLFVKLGKMGIAEELDRKHLAADTSIARTWERSRPWEKHIQISTTEFCDGIFPFTATREHTFTRDNDNDDEDPILRAIRRNPHLSPDTVRLAFRCGCKDILD